MKKKVLFINRLLTHRFLIFVVLFVAIFNFLGVYLLPRETFLVFASDIDLNELVELTNNDREIRGLYPLTVDTRLVKATQQKGEDMLEKDYWAHYGPNGESPWQFILQNDYNYIYAGENLAKDFSSAEPIHSAWMSSPSHRSNILNPNFKNIGISTVTGEFQGNVTTIVVVMFGSLEEEATSSSQDQQVSPFTPLLEEGNLEAPSITDPKEGDILDSGDFDVRGEAKEGSTIKIYDHDDYIGKSEIQEGLFKYKHREKYDEGEHLFFAQAEYSSSQKSTLSNIVSVTVDTIYPKIDKGSAMFTYASLLENETTYVFQLEVEDNPSTVYGFYGDIKVLFTKYNSFWEAEIKDSFDTFEYFTIVAEDEAGNKSEEIISQSELYSLSESINTSLASFAKKQDVSIMGDLISRILTRSMRGRVNFFIASLMLLLLVVERFMLVKTGFTKQYSYSLLHLPVFAIIIFTALIGSGGEIL